MRKLILPGIVFACGMAGTVQAATQGSGPVYGGASQRGVLCEIVNVGNTRMTFVKTAIYDEFHGSIALSFNSCVGSVGQGKICNFQAPATNDQAYACQVITNGGILRGTMRALDSSSNTLSETEVH